MRKRAKIFLTIMMFLCLCITDCYRYPIRSNAAASIKISKKSATLIKGKTLKLKIIGTNKKVKWSSSKKKVATVSSTGKVTAKSRGTATITAKVGNKKYTCKIKVQTPKLSKTKISINKGKTAQLKLNGNSQKVRWGSTNKKVATVTSKGVVKGINAGTCKIYASVGGKKFYCKVTVKKSSNDIITSPSKPNSIPVSVFSINQFSMKIKEGESSKIGTYIYPSNASNKTIKWSTSNSSVATVDNNGNVFGVGVGNATITASCGGFTSSCKVEVDINFNEQEALNNITYQTHKTESGIVVIVKNNYKYNMNLSMDCLYYNSYGTMVGKRSDYNYALESGRECALFVGNPYGSDYNDIEYSSYKVVFKAEETDILGNANNISAIGSYGANNVMVTVKNNGSANEFTNISIVFYKNGKIIDYDDSYAEVNNPGEIDYLQFNYPYDSEYNTIVPDGFKVYVNDSYSYSW